MLMWMCGVAKKDDIRNEHIKGTTNVIRREEQLILTRVLGGEIPGQIRRRRLTIR